LILNPVIYYLNYSKIIELYEIQHPNYYYYVILLEILLLGLFIILQYRNKIRESINFLKAKINAEQGLKIEKETKEVSIKNAVFESQTRLLNDLSKDLHDDLGQKLSVISISLENLKLKFQSEEINQLKQITVEVSNSIRNLSHWLNDYEFQNKEIAEIIELDILRINKLQSTQVKIDKTQKTKLNTNEKIIIFRVYQELINNSLKHSKSSYIKIEFFENQIVFSDNGIGISAVSNNGIGLKNIIERLQIINWKMERKDGVTIIYRV
jgi:signal transduction histidine kinase